MARNLGRPRESWLRSGSTDEQWAAAMSTCQSPAGDCGQLGFCKYGDCFTAYKRDNTERIEKLEKTLRALEAVIEELRGERSA